MTPAAVPAAAEVVVVGGGPAGAAVAGLLARRGVAVVLLEKAMGRGDAGPPAVDALLPGVRPVFADLGLDSDAYDAGWQRARGETMLAPGAPPVTSPFAGPYDHGYLVDRGDLGRALIRRAALLGATVVPGVTVTGPVVVDGAVTGVRLAGGGTVAAGVVVDASGPARVVSGPLRTADPAPGPDVVVRARLTGVRLEQPDHQVVSVAAGEPAWCWLTPLGGDAVEVGRMVREAGAARHFDDWRACLAGTGLAALVGGAAHAGPVVAGEWAYHSARPVAGPGWLCVGDAAGVVEPVLSPTATVTLLGARAAAEAVALGRDAMTSYATGYLAVLDTLREFAAVAFDTGTPGDRTADALLGLANSPATGAAMARIRGALGGALPLVDVECPDGPLLAGLR